MPKPSEQTRRIYRWIVQEIGFLGFCLSVVNFIFLVIAYSANRRQWDTLNLARVELTDVGFISWRELTRPEALRTKWGYKPDLYARQQPFFRSDTYSLPYQLVLISPTYNHGISACSTTAIAVSSLTCPKSTPTKY